ncbi:hypothetical protein L6R50_11345 [Myxococcota bacterium]|nr:hypothetical protein [Myxococcota bacterium]
MRARPFPASRPSLGLALAWWFLAAAGCGGAPEGSPGAPAPAPPAADPQVAMREDAGRRLEIAWKAAGALAGLERDLPPDLSSIARSGEEPEAAGGPPSPRALAAQRAYAARKELRPAEERPMSAGSQPELAMALNTATRELAQAAREYETMAAALGRGGVALAERARAAGNFRRGEGVDALRTALPAAFIAGAPGTYEIDGDGGTWRCVAGTWTEGGTDRTRGTCTEGRGAAPGAEAK